MTKPINQSNVLVVGGGSGIGLGIAKAFDLEGATVAIAGRTESKLVDAIAGTSMLARVCDASDREQVAGLLDWFGQEVGQIDILAFCAGVNVPKRSFSDMVPEDFDEIIRINLTGAFNCIYPVLEQMRERKDGLIFNVTSIAGIQTMPVVGVQYSISKTAQTCLGNFANFEGLPEGVRLTNVFPGETNTPILENRPSPPPMDQRENMVYPEDIAAMVLAVAKLPKRAVVPELIVTTTYQPRT